MRSGSNRPRLNGPSGRNGGGPKKLRKIFERNLLLLASLFSRRAERLITRRSSGGYLLEITTNNRFARWAAVFGLTLYRRRSVSSISKALWWSPFRNLANPLTPIWCWNGPKRLARLPLALRMKVTEYAGATCRPQHLLVRAGEEKSVAATKTYTGQLACLYLAGLRARRAHRAARFGAAACLERGGIEVRAGDAGARGEVVLHAYCGVRRARDHLLQFVRVCAEIDGDAAMWWLSGFSSADLLHGPIAMLEAQLPAFVFGWQGRPGSPLAS